MEEDEKILETEVPKEALSFIERNSLSMRYEGTADKWDEFVTKDDAERACRVALENQWIPLSERPLEEGVEVIGYNKFWIDLDFNPNGTRIGFINGDGQFTSAKWNNTHDCYDTMSEEGDDYFAHQEQADGTVKKWCICPGGGEMLGHLPNMPTHYMFIAKHPLIIMDIGSGNTYPSNALSNFAPHPFVIDGVECNSMEGFLQSLKFDSVDMQRYVCTLVGKAAKFKGKNKKWWKKQELYWNGVTYKRDSEEYQQLLDRAYDAIFENSGFRKALEASRGMTLTHSMGKSDRTKTVLTTSEFISRLLRLRKKIEQGEALF